VFVVIFDSYEGWYQYGFMDIYDSNCFQKPGSTLVQYMFCAAGPKAYRKIKNRACGKKGYNESKIKQPFNEVVALLVFTPHHSHRPKNQSPTMPVAASWPCFRGYSVSWGLEVGGMTYE
jgi:hypothetical protein